MEEINPTPAEPTPAPENPAPAEPTPAPAEPTPTPAPANPAPAEPPSLAINVPKDEPAPAEDVGASSEYGPFTVPEGFDAPMDEFRDWAKEHGLSQKQAQSAVDFYCKTIIPQQAQKQEEIIAEWKKQTNYQLGSQGIAQANRALDLLAQKNPLLKPFLNDSGLINHPVVMGLLCDLSGTLLEGVAGVPHNAVTPMAQRTLASSLFPNSLK